VGRLKPGVSIEQAQAEMTGISKTAGTAISGMQKGWTSLVISLNEATVGNIRATHAGSVWSGRFLALADMHRDVSHRLR